MWEKYPEIASELELVEEYISKRVYSRNRLLSNITGELIASGGKRLRPGLLIAAAKFGQYDGAKIIPAAGALEVLHTATLVHDDIIDKASTRRGKPTVSEKFGHDMAVYTGDFLFTKAILMLSGNLPVSELDKVARAVMVICEGEVDQYMDRFNLDISVPSYLKKTGRKTAVLFGAACSMGGYLSGCPSEVNRALTRYGLNYGMAFQLRDDLNDINLNSSESGKPVGHDIIKGVITLPAIYAIKNSKIFRDKIVDINGRQLQPTLKETADLLELLKSNGGVTASQKMLERFIARGIRQLEKLPDNQYKNMLKELIEKLA